MSIQQPRMGRTRQQQEDCEGTREVGSLLPSEEEHSL